MVNMKQSYAAAEIEARQVQATLWRDADPVPLLEFQRGHQKLVHIDSRNHTVSHADKNPRGNLFKLTAIR